MAGLSNKPSLYDFSSEQAAASNPLDEWARSPDRGGHINLSHPNDVAYVTQAVQGIMNGQISEEGAKNLAQRVNGIAPHVLQALAQRKAALQSKNEMGQYFNPGSPAEYQGYGPPSPDTGQFPQSKEAVSPKMDFQGAIALALNRGDYTRAEMLQKMSKEAGGGKGLYGGIQYAFDPKTKQYVPYSVDEGTRKPVAIETPTGTVATVPMGFQNVTGPGGVNQIVALPTRGTPGTAPQVTGTGLMPDRTFTPETAGKLKMLDQGMSDVQSARGMLFDEKGKLRKDVLAGASVPGVAGVGEKSRMFYSAIENAVSAKYRAETGAAGNADEIRSVARRFTPGILDSEKSAADKLDRLEQFLGTTYDAVDPGKVYPRIAKPTQQRIPANSNTSTAPTGLTPNQQRLKALLNGR